MILEKATIHVDDFVKIGQKKSELLHRHRSSKGPYEIADHAMVPRRELKNRESDGRPRAGRPGPVSASSELHSKGAHQPAHGQGPCSTHAVQP